MSVIENLKTVSKAGRFLKNRQKNSDFIKRGSVGETKKTAIVNGRQVQITSISATEG
ncbi:hypothetical protein BN136_3781 [Cronobacter universalis NCTC 9529]|nr:hypothetical protein BN136_3781 [Cronobacter universalis NCTC 9529]